MAVSLNDQGSLSRFDLILIKQRLAGRALIIGLFAGAFAGRIHLRDQGAIVVAGRRNFAGVHHLSARLADLILGALAFAGGRRCGLPLGTRVQAVHIHLTTGHGERNIFFLIVVDTLVRHGHVKGIPAFLVDCGIFDLEFERRQREATAFVFRQSILIDQDIRVIRRFLAGGQGRIREHIPVLCHNILKFICGKNHQFHLIGIITDLQRDGNDAAGGFCIHLDRHIHRIPRIAADSRQSDLHRLGRHGRQHRHAGNQQCHGQQQR